MPSPTEAAIANQAMSANYRNDSPDYAAYTSRIPSEEFAGKINRQFAHYSGILGKDYATRMLDIAPRSIAPIGRDGASLMEGYKKTPQGAQKQIEDSYRSSLADIILNFGYHRNYH